MRTHSSRSPIVFFYQDSCVTVLDHASTTCSPCVPPYVFLMLSLCLPYVFLMLSLCIPCVFLMYSFCLPILRCTACTDWKFSFQGVNADRSLFFISDTHTHTHTRAHIHTHTNTHSHTHTHAHTRAHTHML